MSVPDLRCIFCNSKYHTYRNCPVTYQKSAQKTVEASAKQDYTGQTPNVFVGHYGYPSVNVGLLNTEEYQDHDDPLNLREQPPDGAPFHQAVFVVEGYLARGYPSDAETVLRSLGVFGGDEGDAMALDLQLMGEGLDRSRYAVDAGEVNVGHEQCMHPGGLER